MRQFGVGVVGETIGFQKGPPQAPVFCSADLALKKRISAILNREYFNIYWRCNVILCAF